MSEATPAITIDKLRVRLSGTEILRGVDSRVPRGHVVGLVGPNGAGKSTLLRAVCGLLPMDEGSVEVDGVLLDQLSRRQIAQKVCLLPQEGNLAFSFTVREIVAMGRNPHLGRFQPFGEQDKRIVDWAMGQASVGQLADRPVNRLSGGEKQRVLLARCLATETPLLLLDEPTASLDILHQLEVVDLLRQFAGRGKSVVVALHDLNLARRVCSHVILLHRGEIAAQGAPEEALCADTVERVFGVRIAGSSDGGLIFALPGRQQDEN